MTKTAGAAIGVCAVLSIGTGTAPAAALLLTNLDAIDATFTVIEGDSQTGSVARAGEKIELCRHGCVIRLSNGESYDFDGDEAVLMEDGLLMLDRIPERPKAP